MPPVGAVFNRTVSAQLKTARTKDGARVPNMGHVYQTRGAS